MTAILLATLIPLAYAAGWLLFARWYYQLKRPFTEPLSCRWPTLHAAEPHIDSCYERPGSTISSVREAATVTFLLGAIWIACLACYGFARLAMAATGAGSRPLPSEVEARTKRLERELGIGDKR